MTFLTVLGQFTLLRMNVSFHFTKAENSYQSILLQFAVLITLCRPTAINLNTRPIRSKHLAIKDLFTMFAVVVIHCKNVHCSVYVMFTGHPYDPIDISCGARCPFLKRPDDEYLRKCMYLFAKEKSKRMEEQTAAEYRLFSRLFTVSSDPCYGCAFCASLAKHRMHIHSRALFAT